jgi:hypothetical protein
MAKRIFVDRFDHKSYTLSAEEAQEFTSDVAVVYDYHNQNPTLSITGIHTLEDVKEIIYTIEEQQKDVECFGVMITELNANEKD